MDMSRPPPPTPPTSPTQKSGFERDRSAVRAIEGASTARIRTLARHSTDEFAAAYTSSDARMTSSQPATSSNALRLERRESQTLRGHLLLAGHGGVHCSSIYGRLASQQLSNVRRRLE